MFQTILFDLDGTLTDPKEGITRSVQFALQRLRIQVADPDQLTPFIGPPLLDSFKTFYGLSDTLAQTAIAFYRQRFGTVGMFENKVYPGILPMLATLTDTGRTLAVATSKPEVYTHQILERFGLAPYFSVVAGSELDGRRTNKTEVIREALARLGGPDPAGTAMVGDRCFDITGAKNCGLTAIGVRYGYAAAGELAAAGADFLADNVNQLALLLCGV